MYLIILAAGNSKRFKADKLNEKLLDKRIFEYVFDIYKDIEDLEKKIVVYSKEREYLKESKVSKNFLFVKNENPSLGISSSIKEGLLYLKGLNLKKEAVMFATCDQIFLKKSTVEAMIKRYKESKKGILSLAFKDKLSNPKIFSNKYIVELEKLENDIGGKQIIKKHREDLEIFNIDNSIELFDIDTEEDFKFIKTLL